MPFRCVNQLSVCHFALPEVFLLTSCWCWDWHVGATTREGFQRLANSIANLGVGDSFHCFKFGWQFSASLTCGLVCVTYFWWWFGITKLDFHKLDYIAKRRDRMQCAVVSAMRRTFTFLRCLGWTTALFSYFRWQCFHISDMWFRCVCPLFVYDFCITDRIFTN